MTEQADWYSWGMILIQAVSGRLPTTESDKRKTLDDASIPRGVKKIVQRCIATHWKDRPSDARDVLRAITKWNDA